MSDLKNKAAVVTGGTRGIGLAIARLLLERGARVLICARTRADVDKTVGELREAFPETTFGATCDVRSFEQVTRLFARAMDVLSSIDILINNAGIGSRSHVGDMPVEEWDSTIQTNLSGVFYCCRAAIPMMKAQGSGYIINIGSLAGKTAFPGGGAYCASKFALIGFSEALMQEVRDDHIRVSYVMPGSVNTAFARGGVQDPATSWKLEPEDVARTVVGLLEMHPRALPSRVELRPSEPKK
jgi:NAD(P)-dependent dehydrogenase (short-subunit alcohol dehydrogenase family)